MVGRKARAPASDTIAVITVHGTGDTAATPAGEKWFQTGSAFATGLTEALARRGHKAEIIPHLWSGANSANEREAGAEALMKRVAEVAPSYRSVHIVGHSHGGNVANEAICRLRLPEVMRAATPIGRLTFSRAAAKVSTLTTVGTPYFQARLSRNESFEPMVATALGLFGIVAALTIFAWTFQFMTDQPLWRYGVWALVAAALPLAALIVGFGRRELILKTRLQLTELYRKYRQASLLSVRAIWHPNDEAISFLQKLETLPIEPIGKGMLFKRSRRSSIVAGIRFSIFLMLVALVVGVAGSVLVLLGVPQVVTLFGPVDDSERGALALVMPLIALTVTSALAPIAFGIAYAANRVAFGAIPEWRRAQVNGFVADALRGMAFGRDGAEAIGAVSIKSHAFDTEDCMLQGEVAQRMQAGATVAANQLIDKYRWALFTVGADTNASLTAMAADAMTWDSLIHTTYFDQPEVTELIAEHIAAGVGG